MSAKRRHPWERLIAQSTYAILKEERARQYGASEVTAADLAGLVFGRRQSSAITQAVSRGQVPTGLALQHIRALSQPAARLTDLIPALTPSTPAADLRELFASALTDLRVSPLVVDLARVRNIVLAPGAVRALHSPQWVSRLLLEIILLRRYADRSTVNIELKQGWCVAAGLLDCIARFPALNAMARQVWQVVTDNFLPDIASVKRFGDLMDLTQMHPTPDERRYMALQNERARLQSCVADALASTETPLRIRHLFPDKLGLELYFHFTYRPADFSGDESPPHDTVSNDLSLPSTPRADTPRLDNAGAGDTDEPIRCSGIRRYTPIATSMVALQPPTTNDGWQSITCVKLPCNSRNLRTSLHRRLRPLGNANWEPIPLDSDLTGSFRVAAEQGAE